MLILSLEKHTVGRGPASNAAEKNMWGPQFPVQVHYWGETCKHCITDTRTKTHVSNTVWHPPPLCKCSIKLCGCSQVCALIASHTSFPPSACEPGRALTCTHSVWHQALWWDAPWPALIHRGGSKWRGSKTDRSKGSLSELKANRH